jgi:hypothetical protein
MGLLLVPPAPVLAEKVIRPTIDQEEGGIVYQGLCLKGK